MKNKSNRKLTGREVPLYTRVSKINKSFVTEVSVHADSEAHFIDTLISYARNHMTRTKLKELLNGKKAGNGVSGKVSKPTEAAA
jgi:hypothetical protein